MDSDSRRLDAHPKKLDTYPKKLVRGLDIGGTGEDVGSMSDRTP